MAFIPKDNAKVGDRVRLIRNIKLYQGIFEAGTIVTLTELNERGWGFVDDEGNGCCEAGYSFFEKLNE